MVDIMVQSGIHGHGRRLTAVLKPGRVGQVDRTVRGSLGTVVLHLFAHELGNGSHTRCSQIVAENLEIPFDLVRVPASRMSAPRVSANPN